MVHTGGFNTPIACQASVGLKNLLLLNITFFSSALIVIGKIGLFASSTVSSCSELSVYI